MDDAHLGNGSMTGKQVLITGATSGIGKEIATQLATLGAELVLACRNIESGKRIADEILHSTGAGECAVMFIDTSSQRSIREFVGQYREKYSRLDVLINNAAVHRSLRQTSTDGVELTFATNVLGYYLLTIELLEVLRTSAPARIVNIASSFAKDLDLDDLQFEHRRYEGQKAYAQSKACDRMLTRAFARRLEASGVTVNAMAPGLVIKTDLYRDASPAALFIMRSLSLFVGRTIAQGADTAVWLASSPDAEGLNGRFFKERREISCEFSNDDNEEKLWNICKGLTGTA